MTGTMLGDLLKSLSKEFPEKPIAQERTAPQPYRDPNADALRTTEKGFAYAVMTKAGPLRTGNERGGGSIFHAIEITEGSVSQAKDNGMPALCGQFPSIMWARPGDNAITCKRCARLLEGK